MKKHASIPIFALQRYSNMATNIIEKLQWRYATKKFDASKKLSEEKLDILKEAFNLTATSYGLQPLKMVIVSDPEIKKQLVAITMQQQQVSDASHVLILCIETTLDSAYIKRYFNDVEKTRNTPRHILQPFEQFLIDDFSSKSKEDIKQWMSKQAYLALGNLLTVCALEDIDACPIEGFDPIKYDEFLGLKEKGLQSVLVLPVGHRAEDDLHASLKKVRRGTSQVVMHL